MMHIYIDCLLTMAFLITLFTLPVEVISAGNNLVNLAKSILIFKI